MIEGLVDHHVLGIHHVRTGAHQTVWDLGFLAWGALMIAGGWSLTRRGTLPAQATRTKPGRASKRGNRRELV